LVISISPTDLVPKTVDGTCSSTDRQMIILVSSAPTASFGITLKGGVTLSMYTTNSTNMNDSTKWVPYTTATNFKFKMGELIIFFVVNPSYITQPFQFTYYGTTSANTLKVIFFLLFMAALSF